MTRIEGIEIATPAGKDRRYSSQDVITILDGGTGGNRALPRTTMTASYWTATVSPTVYYTALLPNGSVLTSRTTSGVTLAATGDYTYVQNVVGVDQFIALWDEGDAGDYTLERIMVDT